MYYFILSYMLTRNKNVIVVTIKNYPLLQINIFWTSNNNSQKRNTFKIFQC